LIETYISLHVNAVISALTVDIWC